MPGANRLTDIHPDPMNKQNLTTLLCRSYRGLLPVGILLLSEAVLASSSAPAIGATEAESENLLGETSAEEIAAATDGPTPDAPPIMREDGAVEDQVALADAVEMAEGRAETLTILNTDIPPGSYRRLAWTGTELFEGIQLASPVLIVNGSRPGPTLCLTAAVHGDELNGIEMVRRVMHELRPNRLSGAVIGVPIVNLQGFKSGTRYLPDRRDLNRYFPGNPHGSAASRIAFSFFTEIVSHCTALVDLHTGSFERANLPQLRANMSIPDVATLTEGFGSTVIINSVPRAGTLRHEATKAGIPTVTLEAGGPARLEPSEVKHGVKGIETLLNTLGMVDKISLWGNPEPIYFRTKWIRADRGGILLNEVELGSQVAKGDLLGTISDPITNAQTQVYAPAEGRIIGLARNQVVMPGFAAYHLGIEREQSRSVTAAGTAAGTAMELSGPPATTEADNEADKDELSE